MSRFNGDNSTNWCSANLWKSGVNVVGHRAERAAAPENTLEALLHAVKYGVPVEIDFMLAEDGEVIGLHDAIYDYSEHGSSFHCHRISLVEAPWAIRKTCSMDFGLRDYYVPIATLDQVMEAFQTYQAQTRDGLPSLFLELKIPSALVYKDAELLGGWAAYYVQQSGLSSKVWFTSLSAQALSGAKIRGGKTVMVTNPAGLGGPISAADFVAAIDQAAANGHVALMFDITALFERSDGLYETAKKNHENWRKDINWNLYTSWSSGGIAGSAPDYDIYTKSSWDAATAFLALLNGGIVNRHPTPDEWAKHPPFEDKVWGICGRDIVLPCLYGGPTGSNAPKRTAHNSHGLGRVFVKESTELTGTLPYEKTPVPFPKLPRMYELRHYAQSKGLRLGAYWSDLSLSGGMKRPATLMETQLCAENYPFCGGEAFDVKLQGGRYIGHAVVFDLDFMLVDDLAKTKVQWEWLKAKELKAEHLTSDIWN